MKFLKPIYLFAIAIFFVGCNEDTQFEPELSNPTLDSSYDLVVADVDLNELVGDVTGLSTEKKMKLLSDFYGNQYKQESYAKSLTKSSVTVIACITLVFDGTNYYTRTRTGPSNDFVSSVTTFRGPFSLGFISCTANIYSNGVSIGGKAVAKQNFDCTSSGDRIYARAEARYAPNASTGPYTRAKISCGD